MPHGRDADSPFSPIAEILDDLRVGKIIILVDDEDRENEGDLVCAAELGWADSVNDILDADPDIVNRKSGSFGYTPLHSATSKGYRDLARLLLSSGAEVNATDDMYQKTPLGEALYYGNDAMARLLYRHGGLLPF